MNNWKFKFFTIWFGQAVSILSSAVLQMALIWHLTTTTESAMILSIASIAGFLPTALLGSVAGTLVDRWNHKLTIIKADLFIASISLILVIYTLFANLPLWLILVVLFTRSIGTSFHTPAISAITPLIVPEDKLTKCSGYTQTLQTIGYILGASLATILYPLWGITGMVLLDVVGAIIASITVACIKFDSPIKKNAEKIPSLIAEMKSGYKIIYEQKGLFSLVLIGSLFMFLYSPINALFPLMSISYFNQTIIQASIAEICFTVGMLLGGVLLSTWGGFKNRGTTINTAMALMGLAIGLSGILSNNAFIIFACFCFIMGLAVPFYSGPLMALIQEKIPLEYLGRVFGLYGSLMSLAMLIGLVISGIFADIIGTNIWFLISGTITFILAIIASLIPNIKKIDA